MPAAHRAHCRRPSVAIYYRITLSGDGYGMSPLIMVGRAAYLRMYGLLSAAGTAERRAVLDYRACKERPERANTIEGPQLTSLWRIIPARRAVAAPQGLRLGPYPLRNRPWPPRLTAGIAPAAVSRSQVSLRPRRPAAAAGGDHPATASENGRMRGREGAARSGRPGHGQHACAPPRSSIEPGKAAGEPRMRNRVPGEDLEATELSARWEARMTFPNPPVATERVARLTQRDTGETGGPETRHEKLCSQWSTCHGS